MRIVFAGSGPLGCRALEAIEPAELAAVVTHPDRRGGRGLKPVQSRTAEWARERGVPVLTPEDVNSDASIALLKELGVGLLVVVSYGQILRRRVLDLFPQGCVNVHASLLPQYRGAAPIQWAIASGERETGLSSMFMTEKMDAGDVILQRAVPIAEDDTAGSLQDKLAAELGPLLKDTLALIKEGMAPRTPQDESKATYAPMLKRESGRIDWAMAAQRIYDRVRGFNPWPCCFCMVPNEGGAQKTLRVLKVGVEQGSGEPGEVLATEGDGPLVAAGAGAVRLLEVQPAGGRRMSGAEYQRGHRLKHGCRLV